MNSKEENDTMHEEGKAPEPEAEIEFLIFAYRRADDIPDGVLIDVSSIAKEAGFKFPVAMTSAAWHDTVRVPSNCDCQDATGRLWDVLNVLRYLIATNPNSDSEMVFDVSVLGDDGRLHDVEIKSICGPGDNAEPVITIMLPYED